MCLLMIDDLRSKSAAICARDNQADYEIAEDLFNRFQPKEIPVELCFCDVPSLVHRATKHSWQQSGQCRSLRLGELPEAARYQLVH